MGEQILSHLLALVNQETKVHLLCVVTTHLLHPKNEESVKKYLIHESKACLEHIEEPFEERAATFCAMLNLVARPLKPFSIRKEGRLRSVCHHDARSIGSGQVGARQRGRKGDPRQFAHRTRCASKNPDKSTDALRFPSEMERFGGPQRESPGLMALLNKK